MLNFTFTIDDVNTILTALGELPAKVSVNVIDKIRAQVGPQLAEQESEEEVSE